MKTFTAVVEKCPDTGLFVGYVPGFPGAHTQARTLDELNLNLREVIELNCCLKTASRALRRSSLALSKLPSPELWAVCRF